MTVQKMIEVLMTLPLDLPVCLSDWSEQWTDDNESAAERIALIQQSEYWPSEGKDQIVGDYVLIGGQSE